LAIEYASRGVRVNAVSLGIVKTPEHDGGSYDEVGNLHPVGRVAESPTLSTQSSTLREQRSWPARHCTSTAAGQQGADANGATGTRRVMAIGFSGGTLRV
jgi:NAD(P)-dependent dehydrogenase (short-subunit alcohol dehydrogenase family)